jgi:hypothetical protein
LISNNAKGPFSVVAANLNDDHKVDILSAIKQDNKIVWYKNGEDPVRFELEFTISTSAEGAILALAVDLDGDQDLDVLAATDGDDMISWYENTDGLGSFGSAKSISKAEDLCYLTSTFAADLDGDNDLDVLANSYLDGELVWYENTDGAGSFGPRRIVGIASAYTVFAADLDGDQDLDVLSKTNEEGLGIIWFPNEDGKGNFGSAQVISIELANSNVLALDLDLDEDMDVLAAHNNPAVVIWYENTDGLGNFNAHTTYSRKEIIELFVADLDQDNDLDILAAHDVLAVWEDSISWFENINGMGSFEQKEDITTDVNGPFSVYAADLDGDNDLDILSASFYDDKIAWYENLTIH